MSFETGLALTRFDSTGPDLAIRNGEGHWPGLTAHHLMDEELFPAAAPTLPGIEGLSQIEMIAQLRRKRYSLPNRVTHPATGAGFLKSRSRSQN
jgi:DNA-binding transcriptional LysR family regulator